MLEMLKIDLGITGNDFNARLNQYIETAQEQIAQTGITLTNSAADQQLTVMYAAWLWRKRDSMSGMPRMLKYAINNRLFSEKMKTEV